MFKTYTIGELCTWCKGYQVPRDDTSVDKEIPYLHYGDLYKMYDFRLDLPKVHDSIIKIDPSDSIKEGQYLHDGDIVFALTSETVDDLGHCTLICNPDDLPFVSGMETTIIHVENRASVLPSYLNYYFQSSRFQRELRQFVTGMKVYRVHPDDIMKMSISIPDLSEQQRVVAVLNNLSDRVSILSAINDNLLQFARLEYNSFKNNNEYDLRPLSDVASFNAKTIKKIDSFKVINYLDTGSITSGIVSDYQRLDLEIDEIPSRAKRLVQPNDVIFSTVRPNQNHFGILTSIPENCVVSTGFTTISSTNTSISNEMIYLEISSNEVIAAMQQIAETSTSAYPSIRPEDLGEVMVPIFSNCEILNKILANIFQIIDSNQREICALNNHRDFLLPKLMSGEIDVSTLGMPN